MSTSAATRTKQRILASIRPNLGLNTNGTHTYRSLALMFTREGTNQVSIPWEVERGKSLRDLNRIRLLNSRSDLEFEIGIVRDMDETLVLLTKLSMYGCNGPYARRMRTHQKLSFDLQPRNF